MFNVDVDVDVELDIDVDISFRDIHRIRYRCRR